MSNKRLRVVTSSEMRTRRRCALEHHIAYELGIRSALVDAHALRFGTLIHRCLEAWWREPVRALRLTAALAALPLDVDPYDLARAAEMLRGYHLRWVDEPLEMIAVEVEFRAALVNPITGQCSATFELGGKIDALVLNTIDGRVYVVEHKTTSDDFAPGSDYQQALQLDAQVSMYFVGARALGHDPAGVIYDVLGKPKLRPCHATPEADRKYRKIDGKLYAGQTDHDETPDEFQARVRDAIADEPDRYYARGTVVRFDDEETDAQWDMWSVARAIHFDALAGHWPRNPDACRRFGRLCSYFGHCTKTESLDDMTRFRKVEHVHEELAREPPALEASHVTH